MSTLSKELIEYLDEKFPTTGRFLIGGTFILGSTAAVLLTGGKAYKEMAQARKIMAETAKLAAK